jgi:hypothetical protein
MTMSPTRHSACRQLSAIQQTCLQLHCWPSASLILPFRVICLSLTLTQVSRLCWWLRHRALMTCWRWPRPSQCVWVCLLSHWYPSRTSTRTMRGWLRFHLCLVVHGGGAERWLAIRVAMTLSAPSVVAIPGLAPLSILAWLFGWCCRCLTHGHRATICIDPLRCCGCFENDHRARECRNP